ncbi:MAG: hypothetical protein ACOYLK_03075 [Sphingomonas sp.]
MAALSLALAFIAVPFEATLATRIGFSVGASISILALVVTMPAQSGAHLWALALPGALVFVRPVMGTATLFAVAAMAIYLEANPGIVVVYALGALVVSKIANVLVTKVLSYLHEPISTYKDNIAQLITIYLVCFFIITIWFTFAYAAILSVSPDAFTSQSGSEVTIADVALYAGIINASGEPVYLTPISLQARAATLAEMMISFSFTAIYFALVVSRLIDRNNKAH